MSNNDFWGSAGANSPAQAPTAASTQPPVSARPGTEPIKYSTKVRFTTIVWGLILTLVGLLVIARASGLEFDTQLAGIIILGVSGLTLVVSSLVRTIRR